MLNALGGTSLEGSVERCLGVRPAAGPGMAPNCMLAAGPWSSPSRDELAGLVHAPGPAARERPVRPHRGLIVFDAGENVLAEAHARLLPLLLSDGEPADVEPTVADFRRTVLERVEQRCGLRAPPEGRADVVLERPSQVSTAYNHDAGWRMGLHIDNHQRLPLSDRDDADILCSVNLGFADRYLQFVDLCVEELVERLGRRGVPEPATAEALKDAYLTEFPEQTVWRVAIRPGQGYLCNTQNTIHDGMTNTVGQPDVSLLTMNALEPVGEQEEALHHG